MPALNNFNITNIGIFIYTRNKEKPYKGIQDGTGCIKFKYISPLVAIYRGTVERLEE